MTKLTAQQLVQNRIDLVSLPDIALKLNKLCDDTNSTAQDIADVISKDATLTTHLLQIVNSPFYNFPQQIDTITMAITIVGTAQLRDLAMATLVIQKFNKIPTNLISPEKFWRHNIACATAARTIVMELGIQQSERVYIAGLLHDIGKLLMYLAHPELSFEILELIKSNPALNIIELEEVAFGYSHAELGAALLSEWGLPDSLVEPVKFHHLPEKATRYATEASVLHLANVVANKIEPLLPNMGALSLDAKVWAILNSTSDHLDDITAVTKSLYNETIGMFYPESKAA